MPMEAAVALLDKQRYDPSILPQLEAYIEGKGYSLDVNLATLKLYQFHPELLKVGTIAKVLVKALMHLPQTDYLACTYLVPERVLDEEPISHITAVAALLESCHFREFWGALEPLRGEGGLLAAMPDFDAAARSFMLSTFEITYQSVPTAHLRESLGLAADSEVSAHVGPRGWTVEGDLVKIALNDDNTAKPKRVCARARNAARPRRRTVRAARGPWPMLSRECMLVLAGGCWRDDEPFPNDQDLVERVRRRAAVSRCSREQMEPPS